MNARESRLSISTSGDTDSTKTLLRRIVTLSREVPGREVSARMVHEMLHPGQHDIVAEYLWKLREIGGCGHAYEYPSQPESLLIGPTLTL